MVGIINRETGLKVIDIITKRETFNWRCCNLNERQGGGSSNGNAKKVGGDYLNNNTRGASGLINNMKTRGRKMVCDYMLFHIEYSRKALQHFCLLLCTG